MHHNIEYNAIHLPHSPSIVDFAEVASDYNAIIYSMIKVIVDRYQRNSQSSWVDMKFNVIDGKDFPNSDKLRGLGAVYGWIQGRALETLVGFSRWLDENNVIHGNGLLLDKIKYIQSNLLEKLSSVRLKNNGHTFFLMTTDGRPFIFVSQNELKPVALTSDSPYNFSDLFCSKGMYASAYYLQNEKFKTEAKKYCSDVENAIWHDNFISDQQQLDCKNPVSYVEGRISHGPIMILIGTSCLLAEHEKSCESVEFGLKQIEHILQKYVNVDNHWPFLNEYDFVEFIDNNNQPYRTDGKVISDPGHAIEYVGLSLKFANIAKKLDCSKEQFARIKRIEFILPGILKRNFVNGFQPRPGGICKLYDLIGREPVNTDMPWWSLPETIRAALQCVHVTNNKVLKQQCLNIAADCHNAFTNNYIQPKSDLIAIQNLGIDGQPIDIIPAVADVDPGYHTCLCLLDSLKILESAKKDFNSFPWSL